MISQDEECEGNDDLKLLSKVLEAAKPINQKRLENYFKNNKEDESLLARLAKEKEYNHKYAENENLEEGKR